MTTVKTYSNGAVNSIAVTICNTYDYRNQLIECKTGDGTISDYTYNAEGFRVSKISEGEITYYLYEADKVILEVDQDYIT